MTTASNVPGPLDVRILAAQLCAKVPGGTGRYTQGLLQSLSDRRPTGQRLTAILPSGCHPFLPRIETQRLRSPSTVLSRLWERGLPPVLDGSLVHAPTLLVPRVGDRTVLVVTVHDVVPWTHPQTLTSRGVGFHRRMGRVAARQADAIVAPTAAVARQVEQFLSPACRVVVVPPGVLTMTPPTNAEQACARLGLAPRYVLFVGTAEPRKGLDVLLHAMARPELTDRHLVVVGPPGWGGVDVATMARSLGVEERVSVMGRVSDATLAVLYAGAGVLAMPSAAEGFGLPVVEAMSMGVPVVVSDDPALVEVASDAGTVVAVGDSEGLASALAESLERDPRTVARGYRRAAEFTWDAAGDRLWELYLALCAAR